jgi:hypothetical protein
VEDEAYATTFSWQNFSMLAGVSMISKLNAKIGPKREMPNAQLMS